MLCDNLKSGLAIIPKSMDTLDSSIYCGWRIYAHVGEVANTEIPILKMRVKGWFDPKEWGNEDEDSYSISFYHESTKSEVQVTFRPQLTNVETMMGLNRFGVVFKSDFFDWGRRNERLHQQLCDEVSHMIPWQKQAYDLADHEWIPVRRKSILRWKRGVGQTK